MGEQHDAAGARQTGMKNSSGFRPIVDGGSALFFLCAMAIHSSVISQSSR